MIQIPRNFNYMRSTETLARSQVFKRSWPVVLDLCVAGIALAGFYAVVLIVKYWSGRPVPEITISLSPRALPLYAFYSIVRIGLAYLLSLVFAIGYGYIAAYYRRVEALIIAGLDILQSIPVLSFLPGVMLAMVALFPTRQVGVEMGAILLIFTGQVWNMAFSFYSSLKSIPRELGEAATIADTIHNINAPTAVLGNDYCASSCFLMFAAGSIRYYGSWAAFGVHSASDDHGKETSASLEVTTMLAREYARYNVPPAVIGKMVSTPSTSGAWLTAPGRGSGHR